MSNQNPSATKKKFKFPHPVGLMFCIVLIVALCSYFVPAGEYARIQVDGRTVVDPNSYTRVESNPIGVMEFLLAFPTGMTAAASITFSGKLCGKSCL